MVPFLALVALLAVQGVGAGRAAIRSTTVEAARVRAADVDTLIGSWRQTLDVLAHTPSVRERRVDETNRVLEELLRSYPYLLNVSAMDADLFIWAAAQPLNRGQRITGPQSERARLVLERGETDVSERVALASGPGQRAHLVFIRHPVRDDGGQVVGLLQLGLPLETLGTALRLETASPEHPVAIVHADGTLLVGSSGEVLWSSGDGSGTPWSAGLAETSGVVDVRDSAAGEWLVAYQRVGVLPWYALVGTPRHEAFAPLRQLALSTAVTVLVVTAVVGLIGSWLARGITRPIGTLVTAAGRFAARDFSHRVRLGESCELAQVAAAFNQMATQLQSAYEDLEARVSERTAELDAARRDLETLNVGLQATVERQVEQLERTNQLKRYLSPRVAELLVSERAGIGARIRRRELSVLFTDVRGFTSLAEEIEPEDLVDLLNAFLTEMTQAVFDEGGTLDKYLGDGLMAFFGDPIPYQDHADRAVRAALAMRERLAQVQQRWFALGQRPLSIGVGITSGFVTVGAIGSPERLEYTVIGNNVNLAARLVGVARPGEILCDARTAASVEGWALVRDRGPETIRGRARTVNVFEIAGARGPENVPLTLTADRR
jgi:class 3 adenylate cyclase/HAMP domain-containing protein